MEALGSCWPIHWVNWEVQPRHTQHSLGLTVYVVLFVEMICCYARNVGLNRPPPTPSSFSPLWDFYVHGYLKDCPLWFIEWTQWSFSFLDLLSPLPQFIHILCCTTYLYSVIACCPWCEAGSSLTCTFGVLYFPSILTTLVFLKTVQLLTVRVACLISSVARNNLKGSDPHRSQVHYKWVRCLNQQQIVYITRRQQDVSISENWKINSNDWLVGAAMVWWGSPTLG